MRAYNPLDSITGETVKIAAEDNGIVQRFLKRQCNTCKIIDFGLYGDLKNGAKSIGKCHSNFSRYACCHLSPFSLVLIQLGGISGIYFVAMN
jgi:hypothetical protein